jgi:3-oxoadipate enol-lactonase
MTLPFRHVVGVGDPTVVLLHSLALDHAIWDDIVENLRTDCRTIAFDLPGHGASRDLPCYSIEEMADVIGAALSVEVTRPVVVVGLSLGGCVAQAVAIRHPHLLSGLVLADTTAWYGPDAPQAWAQRAQQATDAGLNSLADFQLTRWFTEAYRLANPDTCRRLLDKFSDNDIDRYRQTCASMGAMDLRDGLSGLATPTAILVGDQDAATPIAMAEDMQRRIHGADLEIIPGCRHLSVIERPDVITAAIRRLVASTATI